MSTSTTESPARTRVRVLAARFVVKADRLRGRETPEDIRELAEIHLPEDR